MRPILISLMLGGCYVNPGVMVFDGIEDTDTEDTGIEDTDTEDTGIEDTDIVIEGGKAPSTFWYADTDGDGFGDHSNKLIAATQPEGYVENGLDCDDTDATIYPGATEICNGVDDDCDGEVDEDSEFLYWYADTDSDGHGDPDVWMWACEQPTGYVDNDTDCDDTDAGTNPYMIDIPEDGLDQDCDGGPDDFWLIFTWDTVNNGVYVDPSKESPGWYLAITVVGTSHRGLSVPNSAGGTIDCVALGASDGYCDFDSLIMEATFRLTAITKDDDGATLGEDTATFAATDPDWIEWK